MPPDSDLADFFKHRSLLSVIPEQTSGPTSVVPTGARRRCRLCHRPHRGARGGETGARRRAEAVGL